MVGVSLVRRLIASLLLVAGCVVCLLGLALSKSTTATLYVGLGIARIAAKIMDTPT
jgi:hypothetical protein